jgi:hypothetical protein
LTCDVCTVSLKLVSKMAITPNAELAKKMAYSLFFP